MTTQDMITVPYPQTVRPLSKVNIWYLPDGSKRVRAYLQMECLKQGAQTGVAIEGSNLMKRAFGFKGRVGPLFASQSGSNLVSLTAKTMCSYLARKIDADRSTAVIYWATGPAGASIEVVGDLNAFQVELHDFVGPKVFGSGVQLLPAIRYFVEQFADADWGMYVFLTQGRIDDLEAVKRYTRELAGAIAAGRRNELKLALIGVGEDIDRSPLQQLDDLNTDTGVDVWDYRIAAEMRSLVEIFAEVVDENTPVARSGRILNAAGEVIVDYAEQGVPALLNFTLPPQSRSFSVELDGNLITQPIF